MSPRIVEALGMIAVNLIGNDAGFNVHNSSQYDRDANIFCGCYGCTFIKS